MSAILLAILIILAPCASISAEETTQTDWSGGPKTEAPMLSFADGFGESTGISWSAVPGQVALSSEPLETPIKHLIAGGHDGAYGLYATDFEGDGDIDVIGTTDRSQELIIWFNSGDNPPAWTEHVVDDAFRGGTSVHPVDMDGDGDLDLVAAAQTPGNNIKWWRNEGGDPLTWTRFTIEVRLPVACNLFVADIDGDGDPDVASTSWSGAYIAWWRNDGEPENWTRLMIEDDFPTAHSAFAFDADGDGDNDIVGTSADSGQVVLFLNDQGDGTSWTSQIIGTGMNGVRYATAADIDRDGRMDLAATAFNGQLRWWRNGGGTPVTWTEHLVDPTCFGGHYLMAADLNGDGATDLLVAPWTLN
ncbi:MAG: VCBS repeat-containing protein, partial [Acidobacteriota bacterium]